MILLMLCFWLYLVLSVILPAPIGRKQKLCLCVLALLMSAKMKVNAMLGQDWFSSPDTLPQPLRYLLVFFYGFGVIFLCLTLLADVIQVLPVAWAFWRHQLSRKDWFQWRSRVHLSLAVLTLVLTVWGLYQGQCPPMVKSLELTVKNLPPQADGLTFAVLADLHADPYFGKEHIDDMVKVANGTGADFMLLLGDYVDGEPYRRKDYLEGIRKLQPKVATLGVTGNHEFYSDYKLWKPLLESWGVVMVDNAHRDFPEQGISVVGLPDPVGVRTGFEAPDVRKAVAGRDTSLSAIALVHRPGLARDWLVLPPEQRPILQLSGHTHGGMLPVLRVALGAFNAGFYAGLYDVEGMPLYVSNGTGIWNGFPLRIFCPAEVTLVTLRSGERR